MKHPFARAGQALLLGALLAGPVSAMAPPQPPIQITVDLTESARSLCHAEIDLPVSPGPATFTTPLWIPGAHAPNGPLASVTGVVFTANGKTLPWRRDDVALSEFHVTIPAGVTSLHAHLDAIAPRATRQMAMLEWEALLLYPAGVPVKDIAVLPAVTAPAGWGVGTALVPVGEVPAPPATGADESAHLAPAGSVTTQYAATTIEQLEDSPVLTGRYFHEYPLAPQITPQHFLDVAGDTPDGAALRPGVLQELDNLVREAQAEYGSHHYRAYHFLVTRSDYAGGDGGVEHAQSTDIGMGARTFLDDARQMAEGGLLAHEFTHSWNGKYRRPVGLCQPDFATPLQGRLLWVYEGMTQYLENVLATRAGLKSPQAYREMLALSAADMDCQPGREWRSTEDTAVAVSLLRGHGSPWINWRRGKAFYTEGELLWLDVDTLIRRLTGHAKSLDDFERIFLGKGGDTGPEVLPYDFAELVDDLNQVVAYDWGTFLKQRVSEAHPRADLDGIERGGYRLVYVDQPSQAEQTFSDPDHALYAGQDFWYSLGLRVDEHGALIDVRWGGPADQAKLAPRQKILAVDGAAYSTAVLRAAVAKAKADPGPVHLTVRQEADVFPVDVVYHGGERYPALMRVADTPDDLALITRSRAGPDGKK